MRIGESVYLCKRIPNSKPIAYEKPIEIVTCFNYLTIQNASGYTNATIYGQDINKMWTGIANKLAFENEFHEGDLMYVDGAYPDEKNEKYYGEYANATIDSVQSVNISLKLVLKKRKIN